MPTASSPKPSGDEPAPVRLRPPRKRLGLLVLISVVYVVWMAFLLGIALFG
ncbi:MAG TPA: hypothetical protein VGN57_19915 [Pirellulaceae bacterium]|jgi:hypothetical protein|nr:hypothetical protein [Pirellulaceae bacterium]